MAHRLTIAVLALVCGCASTRSVSLEPQGYASVADSASSAPNRPAFSSVMILRNGNVRAAESATLADFEAALVSSGVRVISPVASGKVSDARGSGAQAVLQVDALEWATDRRFFVLTSSDSKQFTPAGEQEYRKARPRFRWVVEGLALRFAGKLIEVNTGAVVDVLRLEYGSIPSTPLSFEVDRGGVVPKPHDTGVTSYALPAHRQWVENQIVQALLRHITGRG